MPAKLTRASFPSLRLRLIGNTVCGIRQVQYVDPDGNAETDDVELELLFQDGALLRLATASDGESVALSDAPWTDPYDGAFYPENEDYIRSHGKWVVFDVSAQTPFSLLLGQQIQEVRALENEFGTLAGLMILFEGEDSISFFVHCDEGKTRFGHQNQSLSAWKFREMRW